MIGEHREVPRPPRKNANNELVVEISNIVEGAKNTILFDTVSSVPKDSETKIIEYTVPIGKKLFLRGATSTGLCAGIFKLYIDNVLTEMQISAWTERNAKFMSSCEILPGLKVKVTVEHWNGAPHDFYCSIFGEIV